MARSYMFFVGLPMVCMSAGVVQAQSVSELFSDKNCVVGTDVVRCTMPDGTETELDLQAYSIMQAMKGSGGMPDASHFQRLKDAQKAMEDEEKARIDGELREQDRFDTLGEFFQRLLDADHERFLQYFQQEHPDIYYEDVSVIPFDTLQMKDQTDQTLKFELKVGYTSRDGAYFNHPVMGRMRQQVEHLKSLYIELTEDEVVCTRYWYDAKCEIRDYSSIDTDLHLAAYAYLNEN